MKHPIHHDDNFDFQRHFRELVHQVLPIMVMVFAAGLIAFLIWGPQKKGADSPVVGDPLTGTPPRVGLLPASATAVSNHITGESANATLPLLPFDPAFVVPRPLDLAGAPQAARFDAPMGSPLGALTYNAQPFLTTRHLGDDINGIGGWDSDLGDTVYASGDGIVLYSGWASDGWGNIVQILHRLPNGDSITTFYGHLRDMRLPVGALVRRGDPIGTVGKADGRYLAHLHFEVRNAASLAPGAGYADRPLNRKAGETFLQTWRGAPEDRQNPSLGGDWDTRLPGKNVDDTGEGTPIQIRTEKSSAP